MGYISLDTFFKNEQYFGKSDIFAFGIIFLEVLTKKYCVCESENLFIENEKFKKI